MSSSALLRYTTHADTTNIRGIQLAALPCQAYDIPPTPSQYNLDSPRRRRKFKRYISSDWEKLWLENIGEWQNGRICAALEGQKVQLSKFMKTTCSAMTDTSWCLLDDSIEQTELGTITKIWYNTETGEVSRDKPSAVGEVKPVRAIIPDDPSIFSRFEYIEEDGSVTTQYIEPLVSHLRHPMMGCFTEDLSIFLLDRTWIVPPEHIWNSEAYYFDAGAGSWSEGWGGPSMSYFVAVWGRHGIEFQHIEGWEGSTTAEDFQKTVPLEYQTRTRFHQQWIASSPDGVPFLPTVFRETTRKEDYVLFKLDIDNGPVEVGTVEHLLADGNDDLDYIDEFFWEHHVENYLMIPSWGEQRDKTKTIEDSYQYFLKMRQRGVRAHSWV